MKTWLRGECNSRCNSSCSSPLFHPPRILFLVALLLLSPIALVFAQDGDNSSSTSDTLVPTPSPDPNPSTLTMTTTSTALFTSLKTLDPSLTSDSRPTSTKDSISVSQSTFPTTVPQPFDRTKLTDTGSNFTTTKCPRFFRKFLADPSFRTCVPLSLLLYTSVDFTVLTRSVYQELRGSLISGIICGESSSRRLVRCKSTNMWCDHGLNCRSTCLE